jgi:tetratricopeptide (TPR) repeat protein
MMKWPVLFLAVAALLWTAPAPGQTLPDPGLAPDTEHTPEASAPPVLSSEERIEQLFAALRASDAEDPEAIANRIAELWSRSGSDSMDFLLTRGREALEAEDYDRAIEHLTELVDLEPDFAEAWNARATAFFLKKDYWAAVSDVQKVLALEPRHFGALAGLAIMLEQVGAEAAALAASRAVLEINPHIEGAKEAVKRLAPKVDGRDI